MLSNDSNKEIFSNLDDPVVLWFYVSAEVEALRRASPAVLSPTLLLLFAFLLPQSNDLSTPSLSILQARNAPPEITDFITFYISLGSSEAFGSGPFVQPAGPGMSFDCTEVSVLAQIFFSSLCSAWWMLLLYKLQLPRTHFTLGELSILKIAFLVIYTECN